MTYILFFIIARSEIVSVFHYMQSMSVAVHCLHPILTFTTSMFAHRFEFSRQECFIFTAFGLALF